MNAPTPLRLLIVDDNRDFLDAASAVLEHEGLTVVGIASSRAAALRLVAAVEPDVILVDVDLGDESGLDLTERIAATSSTPVILISVYAESELTDLVAASPAVGFLAKSELGAAAISAVLARGRAAGA